MDLYGLTKSDVQKLQRAIRFVEDPAVRAFRTYRSTRNQPGNVPRLGIISGPIGDNHIFTGVFLNTDTPVEVVCQDAEVVNVAAGRYFLAIKKGIGYEETRWLCVGIYSQLGSEVSSASSRFSSVSSDRSDSESSRSLRSSEILSSSLSESSVSSLEQSSSSSRRSSQSSHSSQSSSMRSSESSREESSHSSQSEASQSSEQSKSSASSSRAKSSLSSLSASSQSDSSRSSSQSSSVSSRQSSSSSSRQRSSLSSSLEETGCPDCCAMITDKQFYLKIERWHLGSKVVDEEGILTHSIGCIWTNPSSYSLEIQFCVDYLGEKCTELSTLIRVPGECAPLAGYAEQEDSGITTQIWWHMI